MLPPICPLAGELPDGTHGRRKIFGRRFCLGSLDVLLPFRLGLVGRRPRRRKSSDRACSKYTRLPFSVSVSAICSYSPHAPQASAFRRPQSRRGGFCSSWAWPASVATRVRGRHGPAGLAAMLVVAFVFLTASRVTAFRVVRFSSAGHQVPERRSWRVNCQEFFSRRRHQEAAKPVPGGIVPVSFSPVARRFERPTLPDQRLD